MKKKVLATLVATMAVGATAFAANPFVDVPADSWAYNSVVELANSGIIQGVDGVHFEGERNITRYEAAEIVAKAMAHEDRANAEQRALINKLADEFSDELNNLGVRVANLENRVGNVKLTGDANIHYQHQKGNIENDASWEYAVHLLATATVNDRTKVNFGISTDDMSFADSNSASSGEDHKLYVDHANVDYSAGSHFNFLVGRYDYQIGNGLGLQYGDTFDGAQMKYFTDHVALTAGYGKFKEGDNEETTPGNDGYVNTWGDLLNVKTAYVSLDGMWDKVGAGVYYNNFVDGEAKAKNLDHLFGGYLSFNFGKKWNLTGDYQRVTKDKETATNPDGNLWGAKLQYGAADPEEKGSWDVWVDYVKADKGAFYGNTANWRDNGYLGYEHGVKGWGVGFDYALAKNVVLAVGQTFGTKNADNSNVKQKEYTSAELDFFF
ncbi:S-layer homology domain-containing protein [Megasphaera coli]|uniref:S-layer homology domain-containing protein n=1 Tax=Colibacter massiliensis TaxID=1852379 RepID=UPI00094F37F4|nr:S-layer homology domain-containing protein [Colibacter massiliensis]